MQTIADKLQADQWTDMIMTLTLCFESSLPAGLEKELDEFFCEVDEEKDDSKLDLTLSKCEIQLLLIYTISHSLEFAYEKWTIEDTNSLLSCIEKSYKFANSLTDRFDFCIKM